MNTWICNAFRKTLPRHPNGRPNRVEVWITNWRISRAHFRSHKSTYRFLSVPFFSRRILRFPDPLFFMNAMLWHICSKRELWSLAITRQWLCNIQQWSNSWKQCLMRSLPRLYNEDKLPLWECLQTDVRKVGGWCEMAVSLRGRELGCRGTYTIWKTLLRRAVKTLTGNTTLWVIEICILQSILCVQ
jgi:hypothetical protein